MPDWIKRHKLINTKMISAASVQHIYQSLALSRDIYGTFCFSSFTPASVAYICFSASLHMAVPTGECLLLCQQLPGSSVPPGPASLPLCQAPSRLTPSSTTMSLGDWCQQPVILRQAFSTWNENTFLGVVESPMFTALICMYGCICTSTELLLHYWKANHLSKLTLNGFFI